jgi:hypothetical protein
MQLVSGAGFGAKYALVVVSVAGYWAVVQVAGWLEGSAWLPEPYVWARYAIATLFGALVLGPYARVPWRTLRIAALCAASILIYEAAIRFVMGGPSGVTAPVAFLVSGSAAALLAGLCAAVLAPLRFGWRPALLLLAAGAIGGAAFDLPLTQDDIMLAGHAAWQSLVCIALHFGTAQRTRPVISSSAS